MFFMENSHDHTSGQDTTAEDSLDSNTPDDPPEAAHLIERSNSLQQVPSFARLRRIPSRPLSQVPEEPPSYTPQTGQKETFRFSECFRSRWHGYVSLAVCSIFLVILAAQCMWIAKLSGRTCRFCPNMWTRNNQTCYFVSKKAVSWKSAWKHCEAAGGTLLVLNETTQKHIDELFTLQQDHWIGLRKDLMSGLWKWLNGSVYRGPVKYSESHMDCAYISVDNSDVIDIGALDCSTPRPWICMKAL